MRLEQLAPPLAISPACEARTRPYVGSSEVYRARVLAIELRGEPFPTFRRRAPRHGCQPCLRGSRLPSRVPSALSPSGPALAGGTTLDQDGRRKRVARRRRLRRAGSSTKRRWHDHRPASQTEQGGAACPVCVSASSRSRSTVRESGSGPRCHGSDGALGGALRGGWRCGGCC